MIVYDFKCTECDKLQERFCKDSSVNTIACNECGGVAERQVSAPSTINGGFYDNGKKEINNMIENIERHTNESQGGH